MRRIVDVRLERRRSRRYGLEIDAKSEAFAIRVVVEHAHVGMSGREWPELEVDRVGRGAYRVRLVDAAAHGAQRLPLVSRASGLHSMLHIRVVVVVVVSVVDRLTGGGIRSAAAAHCLVLLDVEVVADALARLEHVEVVERDLDVMMFGQMNGHIARVALLRPERLGIARTIDHACGFNQSISRLNHYNS